MSDFAEEQPITFTESLDRLLVQHQITKVEMPALYRAISDYYLNEVDRMFELTSVGEQADRAFDLQLIMSALVNTVAKVQEIAQQADNLQEVKIKSHEHFDEALRTLMNKYSVNGPKMLEIALRLLQDGTEKIIAVKEVTARADQAIDGRGLFRTIAKEANEHDKNLLDKCLLFNLGEPVTKEED